ncbi:hypothetical protein Q8F55_004835 [Vanrija albida]|uniref:F-box domain-containing protein n=1 Tax=Vanrija albida TaxID=181172 RepID=A0ABR3PZY5_9TREE
MTMSHTRTAAAGAVTPADIIINAPHIVERILAHATNSTLTTCLRVNRELHEAAGNVLYHTVRVDRFNLAGFFLGAFGGTGTSDGEDEDTGGPEQTEYALPPQKTLRPGFKSSLLGNVRILSLGAHHACVCSLYGPHAAALFPHLDTLRIVPAPKSNHTLQPLCDGRTECALFATAAPRRLVLRNLDGGDPRHSGWPLRLFSYDNPLPYEEMIWVLPTIGVRYYNGGLSLGATWHRAARYTFLFHASWELWHRQQHLAAHFDVVENKICPLKPVDIVEIVSSPFECDVRKRTAIGFEKVQFIDYDEDEDDEIVKLFKRHFPDAHPTSDRLRQFVQDGLCTRELEKFVLRFFPDSDLVYLLDPSSRHSEHITFHTLEEYGTFEPTKRAAVLDDGLPPAFDMALHPDPDLNENLFTIDTNSRSSF